MISSSVLPGIDAHTSYGALDDTYRCNHSQLFVAWFTRFGAELYAAMMRFGAELHANSVLMDFADADVPSSAHAPLNLSAQFKCG